jgi:hypothetical protein
MRHHSLDTIHPLAHTHNHRGRSELSMALELIDPTIASWREDTLAPSFLTMDGNNEKSSESS